MTRHMALRTRRNRDPDAGQDQAWQTTCLGCQAVSYGPDQRAARAAATEHADTANEATDAEETTDA